MKEPSSNNMFLQIPETVNEQEQLLLGLRIWAKPEKIAENENDKPE